VLASHAFSSVRRSSPAAALVDTSTTVARRCAGAALATISTIARWNARR
jgi:hypothetical protein